MNIPDWILDPFSSANTEESPQLQEELMEVTANDELKFKFQSGYQQLWLQKEIPTAYPEIWAQQKASPASEEESKIIDKDLGSISQSGIPGEILVLFKTGSPFDDAHLMISYHTIFIQRSKQS
ncbi:hypothetical protein J437_LFUL016515 [Ladona fulva]|uniref:Uncharacterized protein n=1 Tax=Ladona fulva TaxID=123851 RepID=A0A8K0KT73_LADFU|nr:hypothetical protein J437_LFUL016515 [Ladona fulva]